MRELSRRLDAKVDVACMHVDVDWFKAYNDRYGFARGDLAIKATAQVVIDALGAIPSAEHFLGHIGGDDFLVVTEPGLAEDLARQIVDRFDGIVAGLHDDIDRDRAWIEAIDRMGNLIRTPLMTAVDRHREVPCQPLHDGGRDHRDGERDEDVRQAPARIGLGDRPPAFLSL